MEKADIHYEAAALSVPCGQHRSRPACVQTEFKSSSDTGAECVIQQQLFLPRLTSKKIVADIFRHHDHAVAASHSETSHPDSNQHIGTVSINLLLA